MTIISDTVHEKEELISDTVAYLIFDDMVIIVMSNKNGKLFLHQTRVIARNTCLNSLLKSL